jgi:hypothetical protein
MGSVSLTEVMKELKEAELKPYVYKKAKSGSIYIKFKVDIGGSLRLATHKQRGHYAYRWNLRTDVTKIEAKFKNHMCYYYPAGCFKLMVSDMVREKENRDAW